MITSRSRDPRIPSPVSLRWEKRPGESESDYHSRLKRARNECHKTDSSPDQDLLPDAPGLWVKDGAGWRYQGSSSRPGRSSSRC